MGRRAHIKPVTDISNTLTDTKAANEQASRMISYLNGIFRLHETMRAKQVLDDLSPAQLKAAQAGVDQVVQSVLKEETDARQGTVKSYITAINFVGEVVH